MNYLKATKYLLLTVFIFSVGLIAFSWEEERLGGLIALLSIPNIAGVITYIMLKEQER